LRVRATFGMKYGSRSVSLLPLPLKESTQRDLSFLASQEEKRVRDERTRWILLLLERKQEKDAFTSIPHHPRQGREVHGRTGNTRIFS